MLGSSGVIPVLGVLSFFVINALEIPYLGKDESTVVLVNTVFRHGDRTPDVKNSESFPNDPLQNATFYPLGIGQLTNSGKRRAYELGLLFRRRYDKLLGPVYWQPTLTARSTSVIRSKMTLQLVLAAMYQPPLSQKWNPFLNWQPANTVSMPVSQDGLLLPFVCPTYLEAIEDLVGNPDVDKETKKFDNLRAYLTEKTGKEMKDTYDLFLLFSSFYARTLMGIPLPDWIKPVFPYGELRDATALHYRLSSWTPKLNRRNGGMLLRRMIENMEEKINGTSEDLRFHLFSAQDVTVAAMLNALGLYKDQIPAYSSSMILELHRIHGSYYVKVLYNEGIPENVIEMAIPDCDVLCPYEQFVQLTANVMPSGDELQCDYPEPVEI